MHWAYEGKKLDTVVKYMSWCPPWARGEDPGEVDSDLVGENLVVYDLVGRGRTPAFWWTLNCGWRGYNCVYDIHRLNLGAALASEAVTSAEDVQRAVRHAFVRDRPDIVTYMVALRAELLMRVVMPSVVPHNRRQKCVPLGRNEWGGTTGNPHTHGMVYGAGNPVLSWEHEVAVESEANEEPSVDGRKGVEQGHVGEGDAGDAGGEEATSVESGVEGDETTRPEALAKKPDFFVCGVCGSRDEDVGAAPTRRPRDSKQGRREQRQRAVERKRLELLETEARRAKALEKEAESVSGMERKIGAYFCDLVSEWNPTFSEDGEPRYQWDDELGAHDVWATIAVGDAPERVNLRALLDRAFAGDGPVDLEPVRRLVAALVQKSGRHDMHGKRAPSEKHPCARGKKGCLYCRYGFPHELLGRGGGGRVEVNMGDRPGRWEARFPRNDALVCGYEPHVLLANMGNVDWRPCLNLWAVVEYITKYATKPASGSRKMGDVLKDAVAEVCKYAPKDEEHEVGWRSLQKFYSRMLGERERERLQPV